MMLAFSCFCDAHFHLCDVKSVKINDYSLENDFNSFPLYMGCTSASCKEEFTNQEKFIDLYKKQNKVYKITEKSQAYLIFCLL